VQAYYRPPESELNKLLVGAQNIQNLQQTNEPKKKPGRFGKIGSFFSRLRGKKKNTIPEAPKLPTDEELSDVQRGLKEENTNSLEQRLNKPQSLVEQLQEERRNRGMLPKSQPDSVGVGQAPVKTSRWGKVKGFFSRLGGKKTSPPEQTNTESWDRTSGLKPRGYDPMEQTPAPKPKMLSTTLSPETPQKGDTLAGMTGMNALLGGLLGGLLGQRGGGGGGNTDVSGLSKTVQALTERLKVLEEKVNAL